VDRVLHELAEKEYQQKVVLFLFLFLFVYLLGPGVSMSP
jgi:hypothetical protein